MAELLPRLRAHSERAEDLRKVARIVIEADSIDVPKTVARATLAGDARRLRGLPAVGRGVAGAIRGTSPHSAVLR